MKLVIIGHRGVGKSSLAKRLKDYFLKQKRKVQIFDLDQEVSKQNQKSIEQIFNEDGEPKFRELERERFQDLANQQDEVVIIAGAGFEPIQKFGFEFLWLQRPTDEQGRIFVDRPRLEKDLSPIEEYFKRFQIRDPKYNQLADETLIIGEGFEFSNLAEEKYFTSQIKELGGILTLLPHHLKNLKSKLEWGIEFFELRDDLLTQTEMMAAIEIVPKENILISFRDPKKLSQTESLVQKYSVKFDWPLTYSKRDEAFIVSLHLDNLAEAAEMLENANSIYPHSHLKWAAQIHSFQELMVGHLWQNQDPLRRSFLPMSPKGIWKWYRLWTHQRLQFFRVDRGSAPDQPSLIERLRQSEFMKPLSFAAVLGQPVLHSRSPAEHHDFFKKQNKCFYAIEVGPDEFEFALKQLENFGLTEAAVTSPLKELAFKNSQSNHLNVHEIAATNTLFLNKNRRWIGTNTDLDGVRAIAKNISHVDPALIAVWGGGGTLGVLKKVFPLANYFSARSGLARNSETASTKPTILIWAVGRKNFDQSGIFPPGDWPIEMIIDLNYSEDSPGRECALRYRCAYVSGIEMFKVQAQAQRNFWNEALI